VPSLWDIFLILAGFLPQVFLLYFLLFCITESGLLDLIAKKLSVPSKLLFSVLLGFNCTTLAVCSLESISDEKQRNRAAVLLSFIPCSAMLPLIMLLLSAVLRVSFAWVFLVYFLSVGLGLIMFVLLKNGKTPTDKSNNGGEKLHFPSITKTLRRSVAKTVLFTKKILIAFTLSAFVITFLARFTFEFQYTADKENSILFYICGVLSPLFSPIGLDNPAVICALLFGIIAKESAVSVLLLFPEIVSGLSAAAGLSLIVFYTLYPVCVSCWTAIFTHCGKKTMPKLFFLNLLTAYIFSFIVYNFCAIIV
jgi:ferrous iron transport protein B